MSHQAKPYPIKSGDTKRELRRIIKQGRDGNGVPQDFSEEDWEAVTGITLRYKTSAGVVERAMTKGEAIGEVFYRWLAADATAIVESTTPVTYEMRLTWEDGGEATCPSLGYYTLKGSPVL